MILRGYEFDWKALQRPIQQSPYPAQYSLISPWVICKPDHARRRNDYALFRISQGSLAFGVIGIRSAERRLICWNSFDENQSSFEV